MREKANEKKAVNCFAKYRKISHHQNIRIRLCLCSVRGVNWKKKITLTTIRKPFKCRLKEKKRQFSSIALEMCKHTIYMICVLLSCTTERFFRLYSTFCSLFYAMWCMCLRLREYLISLAYAIQMEFVGFRHQFLFGWEIDIVEMSFPHTFIIDEMLRLNSKIICLPVFVSFVLYSLIFVVGNSLNGTIAAFSSNHRYKEISYDFKTKTKRFRFGALLHDNIQFAEDENRFIVICCLFASFLIFKFNSTARQKTPSSSD